MGDIKIIKELKWVINHISDSWMMVDGEHPYFIYGLSEDEFRKILFDNEARIILNKRRQEFIQKI